MDQGSADAAIGTRHRPAAFVVAGIVVVGWIVLAFAGCATVPTGPQVMVLPGSNKNLAQFEADDASCRGWASRQIGASSNDGAAKSMQDRYDVAYVQCMYASGNQVPVPRGTMPVQARNGAITVDDLRSSIPPPPAGNPPPPPGGVSR